MKAPARVEAACLGLAVAVVAALGAGAMLGRSRIHHGHLRSRLPPALGLSAQGPATDTRPNPAGRPLAVPIAAGGSRAVVGGSRAVVDADARDAPPAVADAPPPAVAGAPAPPPAVTDATDAPIAVAVAFARAEWTSDGTGGLHALARRTAPWASARLESAWAAAPDPPTPAGPAATATIVDAAIVDPRADAVVVQVDVERSWLVGDTAIVDSVPHLLLLTMTDEAGAWSVDDVAVVS